MLPEQLQMITIIIHDRMDTTQNTLLNEKRRKYVFHTCAQIANLLFELNQSVYCYHFVGICSIIYTLKSKPE